MKNLYKCFLFCLYLVVAVGCDEDYVDTLSDVALVITPSATEVVTLRSGEKAQFTLNYYTGTGGYVKHLTVTQFDAVNGDKQLLDKEYTEAQSQETFTYTAEEYFSENTPVELTFTVTESAKNAKTKQVRLLQVKNQQVLLQELTPIVLYLADDKPDAITFAAPMQTFDHLYMADSKQADIYLDVTDDGVLSLMSGTDTKFVRYNNFSYAQATSTNLQVTYNNSIRTEKVDNLSVNDVIIVGHASTVEGVIYVSNIVRTGTDQERCVQLSFKAVSNKAN